MGGGEYVSAPEIFVVLKKGTEEDLLGGYEGLKYMVFLMYFLGLLLRLSGFGCFFVHNSLNFS